LSRCGPEIVGTDTTFVLCVFAPSSQCDRDQAVKLPEHYWAVDGSFPRELFNETGLDLAASVGYSVNFENSTTHYKSGDVMHPDLALGQNLIRQFKVSLVGYAVVQVADHTDSGPTLGRERRVGDRTTQALMRPAFTECAPFCFARPRAAAIQPKPWPCARAFSP
jgi:hypothetical protein